MDSPQEATLTLALRHGCPVPAAYWKISIGQGETWRMVLRLSNPADAELGTPGAPIDLTGYTARMQIRATVGSPGILMQLTSDLGGGITIVGPTGTMSLLIGDMVTAALSWTWAVYDLEIESASGETTRLLRGEVEVQPEVTR
jgi:hypothetical protein